MGEKQNQPFQLSFNASLKVDFQGSRVTSDGGLILIRELDERLGLEKLIVEQLSDSRQGLNKQFTLTDLLRQSVYSRLAGYEDLNDAERLAADPTFRLISSQRIWDRGAALTSTLHWFETELLTKEENRIGLMALNRETLGQAESLDASDRVVLDMDSSESPVHGEQEGSAYNGHFESVCYHPLFLFNSHGDCLAAKLRPGNVHSAEDWDELLLPEIERQRAEGKEVAFRADAAFAKPEIYEELEKRDVKYAIRIPANDTLERDIAELLERPVGRPSHKPVVCYKGFLYQAASWKTARRVVGKVEFHFGELFPRVGFIVTNLSLPSRAVVRFYNKRGTAEQWIKEGKQATHWTRLSCHRFRANEVRLQLSLLAYNLGNLWRRLVLPKRIDSWSLTSLQQRLVKTGGRLVKHARYYWLLLAESHLTRRLFASMLSRIWALPVRTG
ncbi:MAG: IS1380 family transposase [Candidatus Acidiferrales bacterium]